MSLAFTNLSWWLRSSKQKQLPKPKNGSSSLNTGSTTGEIHLLETDSLRLPLVIGKRTSATPRRLKKKLQTRREQTIDKEHDLVLVSSDGGCISDSDSDASDWSVGWSEPHAPGFHTDDEDDDGGFNVLVPCYGHRFVDQGGGGAGLKNTTMDAKVNLPDHYSRESQKYIEQWLSSLKNV